MTGAPGRGIEKSKRKKKKKATAGNGRLLESEARESSNDPEFRLQRGTSSYGVQPLGNLLFQESSHNVRDVGLGSLRLLTDEILLDVLGLLSAEDLGKLALVSKSFYVFVHQDSLWRNLVLNEFRGDFIFRGRWKNAYITTRYPQFSGPTHVPLKVKGFYSDHIFQSWLCASLEIKTEWLSRDNIERRSNISLEEFVKEFEEPNKPLLLTGALDHWPALAKWDREYLLKHAGEVSFACGPVNMKLKDYFSYSDLVEEERPLYIFDSKFAEKAPQLGKDYDIPVYFREDLFSLLGNSRPDFRWLILGPARSGSSFHIDPNSTSAWNAVVRGSKKWVLYPPDVVPPGVYPSPDGAEVASPVSLTEWFMNFYDETRRRKEKPIECICKAGEVVFVPNGWWHIVINLEESIAITQNYVSRSNLLNVLDFLNKPNSKELVSGTRDRETLYDRFRRTYENTFPGTIENLSCEADEKAKKLLKEKISFWDTVADNKQGGGFKFGF
ncbi:histone arginine demethylase JMJD6 [Marchantia polymorpha subsp. ruderalis]|uniref:JmjC domain-containing protein n=2 Tax=Marchantia polymorpha TaxID=3197 RepID=A0A176W4T4_MARPO|nr:hypothetical protein AXG93_3911s1580 [Marchantia polymorpha subsp. ruderalis]PTQ36741.1 hypothetical protein MARPO_0061s0019 [Marchantia polymorpha]BBM99945.1 hypothetical protein Mp_1g25060 [Marchantia polymorpha subsp. ruderalis]|eukprot:PTQ36741.1 hypothetical protein MARPO_0061s0019 [Marchantia polymorpha]